MIVDLLRKENLPEELSWLPLVESGFRVDAISRSRALGLWQFIPSTGYKFGLNRNRYIDERLDPIKSTRAAIGYLKELHNHFGDWSTALAAYNCGENRVLRIIKNQKVNYLDGFWDLYDQLPRETARYVPKFIAVLHIVKNLKKYDLDKIEIDPPLEFETLTVAKKITLKEIAQITDIPENILEQLNPELKRKIVPNGNYALKVPIGSKQELFASQELIFHLNSESVAFLKHRSAIRGVLIADSQSL
jgi:membrane-bound lytic murein transglycosylase D